MPDGPKEQVPAGPFDTATSYSEAYFESMPLASDNLRLGRGVAGMAEQVLPQNSGEPVTISHQEPDRTIELQGYRGHRSSQDGPVAWNCIQLNPRDDEPKVGCDVFTSWTSEEGHQHHRLSGTNGGMVEVVYDPVQSTYTVMTREGFGSLSEKREEGASALRLAALSGDAEPAMEAYGERLAQGLPDDVAFATAIRAEMCPPQQQGQYYCIGAQGLLDADRALEGRQAVTSEVR